MGKKRKKRYLVPARVPSSPGALIQVTKRGYFDFKRTGLVDEKDFIKHIFRR